MKDIISYLTLLTAIVAAYQAYKNQMKIKSFEMLYERRKAVIDDIELYLDELLSLRYDIMVGDDHVSINKYLMGHFQKGIVLYHKTKGANFGGTSDILCASFFSLLTERILMQNEITKVDLQDWISRTANIVSLMYGLAHSGLTKEIEHLAFSPFSRLFIKYRKRPVVHNVE